MSIPHFPSQYKIVMLNNIAAANAVVCDTVSLKNVVRFWWLVHHAGSNDTDLVLTPTQATDVASGTNKATSAVHRIWVGDDVSSSFDDWVEATAAAS